MMPLQKLFRLNFPSDFLFFIILQVLSSLFLVAPIFLSIKFVNTGAFESIAYFSFASNLTIGFTKAVLITTLSLNERGTYSSEKLEHRFPDLLLGGLLVALQFCIALLVLPISIIMLVVLHLGLLGMLKIEYKCQTLAIKKKWIASSAIYLALICIFSVLIIIMTQLGQFNSKTIIQSWAASTILISFGIIALEKKNRSKKAYSAQVDTGVRGYLATDFLLNYGLMQLLYSLGTNLTSSQEMLKYRLLMFLSIPTNIVMQILSTSGLSIIFSDSKNRLKRLAIFDAIAVIPLFICIALFSVVGSKTIAQSLGSLWSELPPLFPYFIAMSISAIFLTHTSMIIKWRNLTKSVFLKKVILSFLQIPCALFAININGALGILQALLLFNILFLIANLLTLRKSIEI
jgi:hypothetical protein